MPVKHLQKLQVLKFRYIISDRFILNSPKFEFFKNNHKIDFAKKLFNYENTGRKKEAVKNMCKSETVVSLPTCACSDASGFDSRFLTGSIFIMQMRL